MNTIILEGIIQNISYSHISNNEKYYKATLIVKRPNTNKEDIINIKFRDFSNIYKDNDKISLIGNIRTYSQKLYNNKCRVEVYCFTKFEKPEVEANNICYLSGNICKKGKMRTLQDGKQVLDIIVANNLELDDGQKLNCYIPCVCWGKIADELDKKNVGDTIEVVGQLQSREYRKYTNNYDYEIRIAHEVNVSKII